MKKESGLLLAAGAALGMALGVVWSPLGRGEQGAPPERPAPPAGGNSGAAGPRPGVTSKPERTRPARPSRPRRGGISSPGGLTPEGLLELVSLFKEPEEMNLMELARHAGMIAHLDAREARVLFLDLLAPVEGESQDLSEMRGFLAGLVFTRFCEVDGPAAMAIFSEQGLREKMDGRADDFLQMGMNSWVAADPEGARRWFEGLMKETDQLAAGGGTKADMKGVLELLHEEKLRESYYRGMARHDADGLAAWAGELQHVEVRENMEGEVLEAMVGQEDTVEGLVTLLDTYDGAAGSDARLEAVRKLSALDAEQAAAWVEKRLPSAERDHHITQVASVLMKQDPAAGAEWYMAREMVEEHRHSDRLQRITWQWGRVDPEAATDWVQSQPDEPVRDGSEAALAQLASHRREWEDAMAWLAGISDEEMRGQALNQVLRQGWNQRNKTMAPALLEAADGAGFGEEARTYGTTEESRR